MYAPLPPAATTEPNPLFAPRQVTLVELQLAVNTAGCITCDVQVAEQPFATVTVTVYVPAANPPVEEVIADVLHK